MSRRRTMRFSVCGKILGVLVGSGMFNSDNESDILMMILISSSIQLLLPSWILLVPRIRAIRGIEQERLFLVASCPIGTRGRYYFGDDHGSAVVPPPCNLSTMLGATLLRVSQVSCKP